MTHDPRVRLVSVAVLACALGYAVSAWRHSGPAAGVTPPASAGSERSADRTALAELHAQIADLRVALDEERSLRGALELEMEVLRWELGTTAPPEAVLPTSSATAAGGADVASAGDASRPPAAPGTPAARGGDSTQSGSWFDLAALTAIGVDEARSETLRESFEDLQMGELYLRDRAMREGTIRTPAYFSEVQKLRNDAREALGAEGYDLMLYASGRNNRVQIRGLLQSSPAAAAGIEVGDIVLRYDDAPILTPVDLTGATAAGKAGSSVAVDVLRDGAVERVYLSRGPLGAQIVPVRRPPLP